jgi:hypothetical protein
MKEKAITNKIGTGLKDKRILLVTPDSPFLDDQRVFPGLGVLYLAAVAIRAGVNIYYTDDVSEIAIADYDVIGISCMTPGRFRQTGYSWRPTRHKLSLRMYAGKV